MKHDYASDLDSAKMSDPIMRTLKDCYIKYKCDTEFNLVISGV